MAKAVIGTDPYKASSTIEVVDRREKAPAKGRYATDNAGYHQMTSVARQRPERTWAVEGANGAGRPPAQRLLADGETVLDVPAKPAARIRVLDTGQGRKPTPRTRIRSRSRRCGPRSCASSTPTRTWSCCGCRSTAGTSSPAPGCRR
jgi:hypothetical protein